MCLGDILIVVLYNISTSSSVSNSSREQLLRNLKRFLDRKHKVRKRWLLPVCGPFYLLGDLAYHSTETRSKASKLQK